MLNECRMLLYHDHAAILSLIKVIQQFSIHIHVLDDVVILP